LPIRDSDSLRAGRTAGRRADSRALAGGRSTPLKLAELIERELGGFVPPKMFDDWEKQ
jgi:hypothetical protein